MRVEDLKGVVMGFQPVNERMCTLRIRARFFNITFICIQAPTEEADDEDKESFYEKLEATYDWVPGHDVKIVLGDMNAKIGKEAVYRPTIGRYIVHNECNNNGMRLVDFTTSKNMMIRSTCSPRKRIHLATWCSPDGVMANQIDHVLIERRHGSDIFYVGSYQGADCDSNHYLVRIKYRLKILNVCNVKAQKQTRFNTSVFKKRREYSGTI
jgi:hypothetical protein